jgi:ferredoxin
MSNWQQSGLCLCRNEDMAGAGLCLRSENRQWGSVVGHNRAVASDIEFPILDICHQALKRRLKGRRAQVLILHDGSGTRDVNRAETCSKEVWTQAVEVCSLDRIGHVDVLLALAMGFDRVLLQHMSAPDTAAIQAQEVELARAMGGKGRLDLYSSARQLCDTLAAIPKTAGRWRTQSPAVVASRRGTARACAAVLLSDKHDPVALPSDAPYGTVQLDASACSMCQSCVWLCPTDALSVGDRKSELLFVESHCIQCGMCRSICPEDALRLEPRLVQSPSVDARKSLHQAAPVYCRSCGKTFTVSPVMDRLLTRFLGGEDVSPAKNARQKNQQCSTCRVREAQGDRNRRMTKAGLMHSEPKRGR